ncbi:MAG: amidohydrolase family protein [Prevotellaceae bacterium]|jgi:cytosine/adenosine deaminase-related metal-dependent hydrolase|nr:amidohydrolase family protein [Prevotellaceae bacterium]
MKKFAAHLLFTGDDFIRNGLLTLDDSGKVLEVSSLGDEIIERQSIEFYNGILCPGFVNAHCHLELSHLCGLFPEGAGMSAFCRRMISSRGNQQSEMQLKMIEYDRRMSSEGIVAVGDISNSSASFAIKQKSRIAYHTFVECFGLDASLAASVLNNAMDLKHLAAKHALKASITPHAPYSMSDALFSATMQGGLADGVISIHNQESADEDDLFRSKSGAMYELFGSSLDEFIFRYEVSLHRVLEKIEPETRLLLIHNVYTSPSDYSYASSRSRNISWILCPSSNLYIENRLPDAHFFASVDASVAIGTDSLASNRSLSIMDELKLLDLHFPSIGLRRLLRWATSGGAAALNLSDTFGYFKPGARPGVVLITDTDLVGRRLRPSSKARLLDC